MEEILEAEKRENAAKPQEIDFDEESEEEPYDDEEEYYGENIEIFGICKICIKGAGRKACPFC